MQKGYYQYQMHYNRECFFVIILQQHYILLTLQCRIFHQQLIREDLPMPVFVLASLTAPPVDVNTSKKVRSNRKNNNNESDIIAQKDKELDDFDHFISYVIFMSNIILDYFTASNHTFFCFIFFDKVIQHDYLGLSCSS